MSKLGSSRGNGSSIVPTTIRRYKVLRNNERYRLIRPVLDDEIDVTLRSIHVNSSLRCDGMNSLFFVKAWNIIKHDMYQAV